MTGERITFDGLTCYVDGAGPPLLLVHSVNAVASAAEVRPLFEHYRASRTVYAPDLPGFGLSDRSERAYTPRLMTDALHAVSAQIRRRSGSGPIDALAVSLGCEFLARAAAEQPDQFARLALVSPTGFSGRKALLGAPGSTRGRPAFHAIVSAPLWADALFRGLTLPAVVRYFLERTWGSRAIDETLWAYDVTTARQPGARHAPLDFLAGNLFSADIQRIYASLTQPVWTSHGVRGDFTDYQGLARLQGRGNWRYTVFPTGTLPYFELPKEFGAEFDAFLGPAAQRQKQGHPAPAERMAEPAPG